MLCSKVELFEAIEKIRGLPVLVVGDIILDRYVWGAVSRISPEAPVPVVDVRRIEDRLGGAANAVRNLVALGCQVSLCGLTGEDSEGRAIVDILSLEGVGSDGILLDTSMPTSLKTRVIAQKQQVLRIDREDLSARRHEVSTSLASKVDSLIDQSKIVIVSDYGKGVVSEALLEVLEQARQSGRLGMKVRPLVVDPHPRNYGIYRGICIAKPNRREAELASGIRIVDRESAVDAARVILKKWNSEMVVITLGEDGLAIVGPSPQEPIFLETVAQEVFDVSGAGDTVTALFSAALASGSSPAVAGDLANIAAGVVVSEVGTAPIELVRLKAEIERLAAAQGAYKA